MDLRISTYKKHSKRVRHALLPVAVLACLIALGQPDTAQAQPVAQTLGWNLSAGPLDRVVEQLAARSGLQIVYAPELLEGVTTAGVNGEYAPGEALKRVLVGTGLVADELNRTTFVLRRVQAAAPDGVNAAQPPAALEEAKITDIGAVAVTGTRIRGGSTPSPVITIGLENIREEGFNDLGGVIRSIPQNYSGGQNPGVAVGAETGAGGNANLNLTGGSSLNLRGLGPDATLTLLNGRRMAYGGFSQTVDISAIPVEAVERIEIVADGASAIYGSDAVGGVGNVVLKRDFDGVALGVRYGTTADGGLTTREYTGTAGALWSGGGLLVTYRDVSADPIYARQRRYTANRMLQPATLYPGSEVRSGLFSIQQSLGERVELRLDALGTKRDQTFNMTDPTYYYLVSADTTTTLVAPGIEFLLPNDWMLSILGTWGKDEHHRDRSRARHGVAVPVQIQGDCWCNSSKVYEVGAEGALFGMAGGDARLALGAGRRTNDFLQFNRLTNTTIIKGAESSSFAYAEINLPLARAGLGDAGMPKLVLTAALRSEDYDTFGSVTTPKLGLVHRPSTDFTLKASWGKSFKTPTLNERFWDQQAVLYPAAWLGGTGYPPGATVLGLAGGNPDLEAERARTWSASVAFHPEAIAGLEMELSWFDIDYVDRVVQPIANFSQSLNIPEYAEFFRFYPTPQEQEELLSAADSFSNATGMPYDPSQVIAIAYPRYLNTSWQRIKGLDLSGSHQFDLGAGRMMMRGSATYLNSTQQTSPTALPFDLAGRLFYPAKVNSRLGAVWNQGGFMASIFVNYASGVTNPIDRVKGGSFTTLDFTLRHSAEASAGFRSGWTASMSIQNLLNRAPPLFDADGIGWAISAPYDSTNYSAVGRFASISVSKRW